MLLSIRLIKCAVTLWGVLHVHNDFMRHYRKAQEEGRL